MVERTKNKTKKTNTEKRFNLFVKEKRRRRRKIIKKEISDDRDLNK